VDVDSSRRGFWWTSGFTRQVFYQDVPTVTRLVPLQLFLKLIKSLFIYSIKVKGLVFYSKAAKGLNNPTIVLNKALVEVIEA
jgi:hypothetical protein